MAVMVDIEFKCVGSLGHTPRSENNLEGQVKKSCLFPA